MADGEKRVRFSQAIVAVGSRPAQLPWLPEDPRIIDSTGALNLNEIPDRLLVLGGGVIGLEMAAVYAAFGSRISVVELSDQLIPGCDPDLVEILRKRVSTEYEQVLTGSSVTSVEPRKDGLHVRILSGSSEMEAVFDTILVAVGRCPNGNTISAELAGIELTEQGFIPADSRQRTNVPHILAIGDVAGAPMLAHKAAYEGKVAAEVAAGKPIANDARVIPTVAYTMPEIAWVGMTDVEAKDRQLAVRKASFPWTASGRAHTLGAENGLNKILVDPDTGALLGAGFIGPHAGELIAEAALAIELGCEPGELALTVHPHPTLSETLALAAEVYEGTITELWLGKK